MIGSRSSSAVSVAIKKLCFYNVHDRKINSGTIRRLSDKRRRTPTASDMRQTGGDD
jgi:hypothetical protein